MHAQGRFVQLLAPKRVQSYKKLLIYANNFALFSKYFCISQKKAVPLHPLTKRLKRLNT
jgi:hypothetical protein